MTYHAVRVGWIYQPKISGRSSFTRPRLLTDGLIVWNSSTIEYIGKYDTVHVPSSVEVIHYPKAILLPAFINGHTHIAETLIRGLVEDKVLETWLFDHVWKVEPQMTSSDAVIATELAVAELVSSGTIGIIDQFYYSDEIATVLDQTGMKAILAPSIFDDNPETGTSENAFQRNLELLQKWSDHDRLKIGLGPHALYTVDHNLFKEIGDIARKYDTWIHTHVSETTTEVNNAKTNWGMTPVEKLQELNVLERTLAAHCVHVSDNDIQLLRENDVTVLHNIQSNLKIGSGIAPIPKLLDAGINIVLGTDGNASNNNLAVLEEIRLTAMLHKGVHQNAELVPTEEVLKMATTNFHTVFGDIYTGILEQGQPCDFTVFNLDNPQGTPVIDPVSNLVYSLSSSDCVMTVANGTILYRDGEFPLLDIAQIKHKAQLSTNRMISSAEYEIPTKYH